MAEFPTAALRLVFVTPGDRPPSASLDLLAAAVAGGITAALLREPQLCAEDRRTFLAAAIRCCREAGVLALVSRDVHLAAELGADGVQCGHAGPSVAQVREQAPELWAGRSAHWPLCSEDSEADWITLSPFCPTPASHPRPLLSEEQVRAVLADRRLGAVVALGGLERQHVSCLPRELAGLAVLRAIACAANPEQAARELREAVDRRWVGIS